MLDLIQNMFLMSVGSYVEIGIWGAIIILALIAEAQTTELIAIWFGVGAIPSLVCAIFEVPVGLQILIFAVVSVVLVLCTRPLVKKFNQKATIPTNADKMIGMVGKVTKAIEPDGKGEIKVNFQLWTAITKGTKEIEVGSEVVIKEIIGNKLLVEQVEEIKL